MKRPPQGFRELEHTADWELEAWAADLPGLFEQAARGMYALSGARLGRGERVQRKLDLSAADEEGLLVNFLGELLYLGEQEGLGFDAFRLSVDDGQLHAELDGRQLVCIDKEIKAVTYHNLRIEAGPQGYMVRLVFDV